MKELCKAKDGVIDVNMDDEVIRGTTVVKEGAVTWPPPAPKLSAGPPAPVAKAAVAAPAKGKGHGAASGPMPVKSTVMMMVGAGLLFWFMRTTLAPTITRWYPAGRGGN